nr:hypothetical protein [uncultured Butyrivibrio sp.]
MRERFTLKTKEGSWHLFALFMALIVIFSACASVIQTGGYRYTVKTVKIDVRGATLSFDQYQPRNIDSDSKVPAIILFHGGSESLAATSLVAWELAKRGFVVLNVSMYSCGESGQPAITDDGTREENYFRGGAQGMYDALNYVRNISYVDQSRVGLWAHSAGTLGCAAAIYLDGAYLTLNDRMLNVLHDEFGIEITEEQLTQNADEIAASALSTEDFEKYNYMKSEQEEKVSTYIKASRMSPGSGFGKTITVAGLEVQRDPQVNALTGSGTHEDDGYYYMGETDQYKGIFHTGGNTVERNGWYSVPDVSMNPDATSTYIGPMFDTTVVNSPELAAAVEDGTARVMFSPETFHNGMLWDDAAISKTVEFFVQSMHYNNGELGASESSPIDSRKVASSYWTLLFTTLSLLSGIGMLVSLIGILRRTELFESCVMDTYEPSIIVKSKNFVIAAVFATIASFYGVWQSSDADLSFKISNATATRWLPWEPGQVRTFTMIICTAVVGLILFLILGFITRNNKDGSVAGLKDVNLAYGWKNFFKSIFLGIILFTAFYVCAAFIKGAFGTRFMFADHSFEMMPTYGFMRTFKYMILMLPFTLIISTLNNLWSLKGVSDRVDTIINVVVTSFGAELCVFIALILTFSSPNHGVVFNLHTILPVIVLAPVMNYIYRKMYKLTGSVWVGAVIVAMLLAWRQAGYVSHQFIYWGPDTIKAFWGFY